MTTPSQDRDRLRWQCRRGLLELDLILQKFLEREYDNLNNDEKNAFTSLLAETDTNLLAFLNQTEKCQDPELNKIIRKLI